jgi:hypothetical protein
MDCVGRIPQHGHAGHLGVNLLEQLKSFLAQVLGDARQSCDVSTWPRKAVDEPGTDRISDYGHDDGNCGGRLLQSDDCWITLRNNQIHLESDQISRQIRNPIRLSLRETVLNDDILSLYVAKVVHSLPECVNRGRIKRRRAHQAYVWDLLSLLRLGGNANTISTARNRSGIGPSDRKAPGPKHCYSETAALVSSSEELLRRGASLCSSTA